MCMAVHVILLLIKDVLPAFEKVHRTHVTAITELKLDYNIAIGIKFQLNLFRKNINTHL